MQLYFREIIKLFRKIRFYTISFLLWQYLIIILKLLKKNLRGRNTCLSISRVFCEIYFLGMLANKKNMCSPWSDKFRKYSNYSDFLGSVICICDLLYF